MHHGSANGSAFARITLVYILNDFFAAFMLEIDVDIGRLVARLRNESREKELGRFGIDFGYTEAKAHCAVRRRTPSLAENVFFLRKSHDIMHSKEIARIIEFLDDAQLFHDVIGDVLGYAMRIAHLSAGPGEIGEMLLRRF